MGAAHGSHWGRAAPTWPPALRDVPRPTDPLWTQALQLMRAGDRWELFIPSELAYGSRGAGGKIGPDEVLIFDLELISFSAGSGGVLGQLQTFATAPLLGPLAPWHLLLFAFLAFRLFGGGAGGDKRRVTASHILVKEESDAEMLRTKLAPCRVHKCWSSRASVLSGVSGAL